MKNVNKTIIMVFLLLASLNIRAAKEWDVKVGEEQNLVVELERNLPGEIISLENTAGRLLFKEILSEGKFRKELKLDLLPEGTYFLKFEKKNCILTTVVKKTKEGIRIREGTEILFKPVFKKETDAVKVYLYNNLNEKVFLEVTDAYGEVVGLATGKETDFKKTLDFSQIPAGEYIVNMKYGDEFFSEAIVID